MSYKLPFVLNFNSILQYTDKSRKPLLYVQLYTTIYLYLCLFNFENFGNYRK